MNELPEPLEQFLQHPPQAPSDAALQEALARQTSALLPRSRKRARWPVIVAAAAVVLAVVSAYFVWRSHQSQAVPKELVEHKNEAAPRDEPRPGPAPEEKPAPPALIGKANPLELEWSAFDAENDQERVRLYFKAGDLYLDKLNDWEAALRCYSQALDHCETRELDFNPDDNWLVMALKRDRRKDN